MHDRVARIGNRKIEIERGELATPLTLDRRRNLLELREDQRRPRQAPDSVDVGLVAGDANPARRKHQIGIVVVVQGDADLMEVVSTLRSARRLAGRLHGWQEKGRKDADDCYDHEQFDQRKTALGRSHCCLTAESHVGFSTRQAHYEDSQSGCIFGNDGGEAIFCLSGNQTRSPLAFGRFYPGGL